MPQLRQFTYLISAVARTDGFSETVCSDSLHYKTLQAFILAKRGERDETKNSLSALGYKIMLLLFSSPECNLQLVFYGKINAFCFRPNKYMYVVCCFCDC